jgi:hypothetical protein
VVRLNLRRGAVPRPRWVQGKLWTRFSEEQLEMSCGKCGKKAKKTTKKVKKKGKK